MADEKWGSITVDDRTVRLPEKEKLENLVKKLIGKSIQIYAENTGRQVAKWSFRNKSLIQESLEFVLNSGKDPLDLVYTMVQGQFGSANVFLFEKSREEDNRIFVPLLNTFEVLSGIVLIADNFATSNLENMVSSIHKEIVERVKANIQTLQNAEEKKEQTNSDKIDEIANKIRSANIEGVQSVITVGPKSSRNKKRNIRVTLQAGETVFDYLFGLDSYFGRLRIVDKDGNLSGRGVKVDINGRDGQTIEHSLSISAFELQESYSEVIYLNDRFYTSIFSSSAIRDDVSSIQMAKVFLMANKEFSEINSIIDKISALVLEDFIAVVRS